MPYYNQFSLRYSSIYQFMQLFAILFFFFWSLYCLSFLELRLLCITPLTPLIFSYLFQQVIPFATSTINSIKNTFKGFGLCSDDIFCESWDDEGKWESDLTTIRSLWRKKIMIYPNIKYDVKCINKTDNIIKCNQILTKVLLIVLCQNYLILGYCLFVSSWYLSKCSSKTVVMEKEQT